MISTIWIISSSLPGGVEGGIGAVNEWWKKSQDNFAITVTKPKGKREKKSQKMSNPNNNKNQPNHQIKTKGKKRGKMIKQPSVLFFLKIGEFLFYIYKKWWGWEGGGGWRREAEEEQSERWMKKREMMNNRRQKRRETTHKGAADTRENCTLIT